MSDITVSITGLGNVGKQVCFMLIDSTQHVKINIVENDLSKYGFFLDLAHAAEFNANIQLHWNNHEMLKTSDFIFHTAGGNVPQKDSRDSVIKKSIKICEKIFSGIVYNASTKIIVLSNPVEQVCEWMVNVADAQSIFSTGTLLDTQRLRYFSNASAKEKKNIWVGGTHNSEMTFYFNNEYKLETDELKQRTILAAKEIKSTVGHTAFGVAYCAVKIYKALSNLDPFYGPLCLMPTNKERRTYNLPNQFRSYLVQVNKDGKVSIDFKNSGVIN